MRKKSPFQTQTLLTVLFPRQHCCFLHSRPRLVGFSTILDTCQSSASPDGTTGCTSSSSAISRCGEGLPEPCSAAKTNLRIRRELRAGDPLSLGHFFLIHSHREPRPAGGITSTSSTTPNPTASARIPMSTCTPCSLLWGKPSLWR